MRTVQSKFAWYFNRLRAMSAPEIAHRVSETLKRNADRTIEGPDQFQVKEGPAPALPHLAERAQNCDERLKADWLAVLEAARSGRFSFLGADWPGMTSNEKWRLDPITGKSWPADRYCFDIAFRHEQALGDIKYVAELNRLQFLQPIAALAAANHDDALARYCAQEIESWIDANPPFRGVNWLSGIELALRVASFLVVAGFIGDSAFTPEQRRKLRATLNAHGFWLRRYPSRFSSANNHLIAEAAALFLLGSLAPDLPNSAEYKSYGASVLTAEAHKQIHDDGVGAEQSPTYTAFTLEWCLLCLYAGDETGCPFPETFRKRLALAAEHLCWITDDGGAQPRIGDDDEGRVIFSQMSLETHYVTSVLGCISASLKRPDLAPPVFTPHLRNILFGAPEVSGGARSASISGVRSFKTGGYTVIREQKSARNALLVFDHGPLGYLSIAAHGHADALAVWLHLDNQPVLVDAGTYLYHSGGKSRDRFRSSNAHNTLVVNGEDQSVASGPFNWSRKANSHLLDLVDAPDAWRVEAEHDGYRRPFGLTHRRSITPGEGPSYCIRDRLLEHFPNKQPPLVRQKIRPNKDLEPRSDAIRTEKAPGTPKGANLEATLRYLIAPALQTQVANDGSAHITKDGRLLLKIAFFIEGAEGQHPLACSVTNASISPRFGRTVNTFDVTLTIPSAILLHSCILTRLTVG
jgi:hypothetical protein